MATQPLHAADLAANSTKREFVSHPRIMLEALEQCSVNGRTPFCCEPINGVLGNAAALMVVLVAAFRDSEIITSAQGKLDEESHIETLRDGVKADALAAVGDLINLALIMVEGTPR